MVEYRERRRSFVVRPGWRIGAVLLLGAGVTACAQQAQTQPIQSPVPGQQGGTPVAPQTVWTPLLSGHDFGGWYTWLPSTGKNSDPKGVFKIEKDGSLHVLDLPPTGAQQEFGYLSTTNTYANYELRLRYKWGEKKFAPRLDTPRDAGVLYNAQGPDRAVDASAGRVWPSCDEFQIKEGETGDLWLLEGTNLSTTVKDNNADPVQYDPFGEPYASTNPNDGYARLIKAGDFEQPGWNDLTLIVSGDQSVQIVNGNVTVRADRLRAPDGSPLTAGRILLQAEGAEVYYRDVQLRPLAYTAPPAGASVLFGGADTSAWQGRAGGPIDWPVQDGALEVKSSGDPNSPNDIQTKAAYQDFRMHLEFKVPVTSENLPEQDRGNSGLYLQGRYELQILDSFNHPLADKNDLGAIYGVRDASSDAALPAGTWQGYDVQFRAARWQGGQKTENARVSVWLNGEKVQGDVELPGSTFLGDPEADAPGPVRLQDHANKVQFRNIWIVPQP